MGPRAAAVTTVLLAGAFLGACGGGEEAVPESAPPAAEATAEGMTDASAATEPSTGAPAGGTAGESPPAEVVTTAEPLPGLPAYTAGYADWPRLNAEPIPPNPSGDPHLGTKNVYASEEARSDGVYPVDTVIVKEIMRPDTDFVGVLAAMRKQAGADPDHHDWVFVEWTRSSPDEPFTELASGDACTSCHMGAAETDYVWIATLGQAG